MAGGAGEAASALKKLKLTLKDPGNASAQQWKDAMWNMLIDCTVRRRRIETGISEASKRVLFFPLLPREASK